MMERQIISSQHDLTYKDIFSVLRAYKFLLYTPHAEKSGDTPNNVFLFISCVPVYSTQQDYYSERVAE